MHVRDVLRHIIRRAVLCSQGTGLSCGNAVVDDSNSPVIRYRSLGITAKTGKRHHPFAFKLPEHTISLLDDFADTLITRDKGKTRSLLVKSLPRHHICVI